MIVISHFVHLRFYKIIVDAFFTLRVFNCNLCCKLKMTCKLQNILSLKSCILVLINKIIDFLISMWVDNNIIFFFRWNLCTELFKIAKL